MGRRFGGMSKAASIGEILKIAFQLPTYAKLLWGLYKDDRVPLSSKGLLLAAIGYIISPVDLIPDFIPWLGQLDDVALFLLVWQIFKSRCPAEVWQEHLERIRRGESDFDRDLTLIREKVGALANTCSKMCDERCKQRR